MSWRRMKKGAAVFALAVALAVPAVPARAAAGPEMPGELVGVWEWLRQWAAEVLAPIIEPDAARSGRSSFIDPNG